MTSDEDRAEMLRIIKTLRERVWEGRITEVDVENWLANYSGAIFVEEEERLHALHLLTHFNYFGAREMRVLLTALYRDLVRYPIIQQIRAANGGTRDDALIAREYRRELEATRFLAMGNPSESSSHLLYYFRQVNRLPKNLFVGQHEIADGPLTDPSSSFQPSGLKRVVFIDDLLGSGQQATSYSRTLLRDMRTLAHRRKVEIRLCYYVLFATPDGLQVARGSLFDEVESLYELDDGQRAFSPESYVYQDCPSFTGPDAGKRVAEHYGMTLDPALALGYRGGQLLLGFQHNVPDNTLPIFWWDEPSPQWRAIFPRFNKVYQ